MTEPVITETQLAGSLIAGMAFLFLLCVGCVVGVVVSRAYDLIRVRRFMDACDDRQTFDPDATPIYEETARYFADFVEWEAEVDPR